MGSYSVTVITSNKGATTPAPPTHIHPLARPGRGVVRVG